MFYYLDNNEFYGSFLWRITDIRRRRRDAIDGKITSIYSPPFYTGRNGYKMCICAYLNGDGIGYHQLVKSTVTTRLCNHMIYIEL